MSCLCSEGMAISIVAKASFADVKTPFCRGEDSIKTEKIDVLLYV